MSSSSWNGARWWKCDFHTHTPASADYGKGPDQTTLLGRSPKEWLLDFMRAEIDCIAVTDHNSGAWIDRLLVARSELKAAETAGFREIEIFPGVEISVNGGVHLLAILGPEKRGSDIDTLLGSVGFIGEKGRSDAVTSKSLEEVIAQVEAFGAIAIPAHADADKGLFRLVGPTLAQVLASDSFDAIELLDRSAQRPSAYSAASKVWAELLGSDSHHPSGAAGQRYPGSHYSWLKMSRPSLDGVRLALRDGPLSVVRSDETSTDPNTHASNVVESISVRNARYMGRPSAFSLKLNPWLNTIVGGRGSGKSSLIEFMRLALGRAPEVPAELQSDFDKYATAYHSRSDGGLLSTDSIVDVIYRKNQSRFRITWSASTGASEIAVEESGDWSKTEGTVEERFPIRIFSQKQIFQLAKNPLALLDVVDESPTVNRRDWDDRRASLHARYLSIRARERELATGLGDASRIRGELDDVTRSMTVFDSSEHRVALQRYQELGREERLVERWDDDLRAIAGRLNDVGARLVPAAIDAEPSELGDSSWSEMVQVASTTRALLANLSNEVLGIAARAEQIHETWRQAMLTSRWKARGDEIRANYESIADRLADGDGNRTLTYADLVKRRYELETQLGDIETRKAELVTLQGEADEILRELRESRAALTARRSQFLSTTVRGSQHVHIEVVPFGSREDLDLELRSTLQREQGGFERDLGKEGLPKYLETLALQSGDFGAALMVFKKELRQLAAGEPTSYQVIDRRLLTHLASLRPEVFDRFDMWFPEDSLRVQYSPSGDRNQLRPIQEGSPGQKTAALLAFLLSYGDEPLVLDQPEDDLDNRLIYDLIVAQLRQVKRKRQVIVVTHNSNIVVNGDSELVVVLTPRGGQTAKACEGSLQEKAVRESICAVMEGGRDAFERRYRRIALEGRRR